MLNKFVFGNECTKPLRTEVTVVNYKCLNCKIRNCIAFDSVAIGICRLSTIICFILLILNFSIYLCILKIKIYNCHIGAKIEWKIHSELLSNPNSIENKKIANTDLFITWFIFGEGQLHKKLTFLSIFWQISRQEQHQPFCIVDISWKWGYVMLVHNSYLRLWWHCLWT